MVIHHCPEFRWGQGRMEQDGGALLTIGVSINEGTPITGWFISWKIHQKWMMPGGTPPWPGNPPFFTSMESPEISCAAKYRTAAFSWKKRRVAGPIWIWPLLESWWCYAQSWESPWETAEILSFGVWTEFKWFNLRRLNVERESAKRFRWCCSRSLETRRLLSGGLENQQLSTHPPSVVGKHGRWPSLAGSTVTSTGASPWWLIGGCGCTRGIAGSRPVRQLLDLLEFFNAFSWPARNQDAKMQETSISGNQPVSQCSSQS